MTSHSTSEDGASTPWYGTVNCPSREQALSLIGNVQGDYGKAVGCFLRGPLTREQPLQSKLHPQMKKMK